jgi:hypothetical protein
MQQAWAVSEKAVTSAGFCEAWAVSDDLGARASGLQCDTEYLASSSTHVRRTWAPVELVGANDEWRSQESIRLMMRTAPAGNVPGKPIRE